MKTITRFTLVVVFFSLIPNNLKSGDSGISFTGDGAWCWFSEPRAVYFKGSYERTYTGWVTSGGDICVGYFDHKTKKSEYKIINTAFEKDDHDNPAIYLTKEGYIWVLYSKHAAKDPIIVHKSAIPESIEKWEDKIELSLNDTVLYKDFRDSYTYVNICRLEEENNKLFIFWRGMDFKPNASASNDNGKSWDKGKLLVLPERIYSQRRPYIKIYGNNKDKIHFVFTDGHPRDEPQNSVYYMYYSNGKVFKANGEIICNWSDIPVNPEKADKIYDAGPSGHKAWIWDVAEDKNGYPVIAYTRFPSDSNHIYYYARWNGVKWEDHKITDAGPWFPHTPEGKVEREPNYSGGISIDHETPNIVYLSKKVNNIFEIQKWETHDGGQSWKQLAITSSSVKDNVRPFAIWGAGEEVKEQVLWMELNKYIHYTNFNSGIKIY